MSSAAASPPGPRGSLLLGNLREFARDNLRYFQRQIGAHGDVVGGRFFNRRFVVLGHPDLVEQVLLVQHRNFKKHSFFWRHVTALFGRGLLVSEGDFWLRQRRLAAPAFHGRRIAAYAGDMVAFAERMLDDWRDGEARDAHQEMMRLTMQIVAKTLFDAEVSEDYAEISRAFDDVVEEIALRFRQPLPIPDWVPMARNRRYLAAVRQLDSLVYRFIAERRADPRDRGDLLSMLLAARDDDGAGMSDVQVRDEVITLFLAGHETTAIALSWTWYLLARHPEAEARLGAELDAVLAGRAPALEDLPRLVYAEQVVKESMRLFPPAYAFGREALADCEIGGYRVPAKTTVFISQWATHRDGRFFPDPETFRPERWTADFEAALPRYAYLPFGGGPRICIGNRFAMMEAVLLLATVARRYRLRLASEAEIEPFASITLRPVGGVPVRLEARQRAASAA
ncbi:MAG TPA: cytochrome P450 [Thermoanaerobaculia bacterium]|jgi:cytochrome P450|nr:cytochrome P450 [Thermoanaerobaculia bacterium]